MIGYCINRDHFGQVKCQGKGIKSGMKKADYPIDQYKMVINVVYGLLSTLHPRV